MKPNVSTGLFGYLIAGHLGHRSFLIKSVFLIRAPHTSCIRMSWKWYFKMCVPGPHPGYTKSELLRLVPSTKHPRSASQTSVCI